jgi:hypothetical protein
MNLKALTRVNTGAGQARITRTTARPVLTTALSVNGDAKCGWNECKQKSGNHVCRVDESMVP